MEDYVIIDTVLQATHMSNFTPKPKHLKRYEIRTAEKGFRKEIDTKRIFDGPKNDRFSHREISRPAFTWRENNQADTDRNKIKTKTILDQKEKISPSKRDTKIDNFTNQFFYKKMIAPKSAKQNISKSATLLKNPQIQKCLFYDINFDQVQRRKRNCIITPESTKRKKRSSKMKKMGKNDDAKYIVNIRDLVKQEWEEQKKKRQIQSRSGVHMARKKAFLHRQAKKTEQKSTGKEFDEYGCDEYQKWSRQNCKISSQLESKKTCPLSQQQINVHAVGIMQKYGIDTSKSYFKYFSN